MAAERPFGPEPITTASYAWGRAKVNVSSIADPFRDDRLVVYGSRRIQVRGCATSVINTQPSYPIYSMQHEEKMVVSFGASKPAAPLLVIAPSFRLTLLG
jgi:hypothetical protein